MSHFGNRLQCLWSQNRRKFVGLGVRIWLVLFFAIAALWSGLLLASSESLRISLEPPGLYEIATGANSWTVYLDGFIEPGSDQRVAKEFNRIPRSPFDVYLNSPGGDFLTGIKLGQLLRDKGRGPISENRLLASASQSPENAIAPARWLISAATIDL